MSPDSAIEVVPGDNYELLEYSGRARGSTRDLDRKTPHGFEEVWQQEGLPSLCDAVRIQYEEILNTMPSELRKHHLQRYSRIQLYALFCPQNSFEACQMHIRRKRQAQDNIPEFGGLLFNSARVKPEDLNDPNHRIHENIAHELGHITTFDAVCAAETISEAYANGIAGKFKPTQFSSILDPKSIRATTGLRLADLSKQKQCAGYTQALYLASPLALSNVPIEKIWKTVTLLTKDRTGNTLPGSSEIIATIRTVLGNDADEILQRPTFSPMVEGDHQLIFPERNRGAVFTTAFSAIRYQNGIGLIDKTTNIDIEARGSGGAAVANPSMDGIKRIDYDGLLNVFRNVGTDPANINGFICKLGKYKFVLEKNRVTFENEK